MNPRLPDYVRGALAAARLAIKNARVSRDYPVKNAEDALDFGVSNKEHTE